MMHNFSIDYLTSVVSTPEKYPENDVVAPSVGNSSTAHGDSSGVWSGDSSSHSTPDRPDGNGSLAQALLSTDNVKTPPKTPTGQFSSPEGEKQSNDKDKDKPSHSYVALITQAILSTIDKKMVLGDIYQYIMDNFSYYNNQQRAWRNSIRHNLSLNECFIKAGKADNGKGNYWAIHPDCEEDFAKGDFRRRQARRRAKRGSRSLDISALPAQYRYHLPYVAMSSSSRLMPYHPYKAPMMYRQPVPNYTVAPPAVMSRTSPSNLASGLFPQVTCGYQPSNIVMTTASSPLMTSTPLRGMGSPMTTFTSQNTHLTASPYQNTMATPFPMTTMSSPCVTTPTQSMGFFSAPSSSHRPLSTQYHLPSW